MLPPRGHTTGDSSPSSAPDQMLLREDQPFFLKGPLTTVCSAVLFTAVQFEAPTTVCTSDVQTVGKADWNPHCYSYSVSEDLL